MMPLEVEAKYLHADHAALRAALKRRGAGLLGRWFESNIVFDDAGRRLKARGTLLRLRRKHGIAVLTLKREAPGHEGSENKVRAEYETTVSDPAALTEILAGLGLTPALRYEKVREKWTLFGCAVCLDTLPFGSFAEIEGREDSIAACGEALGLPRDKASKASYHELNRRIRAAAGLPPCESFVFDAGRRAALLAELQRNSPIPLDSTAPNA